MDIDILITLLLKEYYRSFYDSHPIPPHLRQNIQQMVNSHFESKKENEVSHGH